MASRGEFLVQLFYATAAGIGFAYVSVLIFALATGNREPLTEHPGLTALLCLLSGISLANQCRQRSARFWKIADLVWIVTFVPSLGMTVSLHFQEVTQEHYEEMLAQAVDQNIRDVEAWKRQQIDHCRPAKGPYEKICEVLPSFIQIVGYIGSENRSYQATVETSKNLEQGPQDNIQHRLVFIDLYERVGPLDLERALSKLLEHIQGFDSIEFSFELKEVKLNSAKFNEMVQKIRYLHAEHMTAMLLDGEEPTQYYEDVYQVMNLTNLIFSVSQAIQRFEKLKSLYQSELRDQIPNIKFIPLIFACFIFPFRVGKSIFEIVANKESSNAPVSS